LRPAPGNLIENGSPRAAQTKADNTRSTVSVSEIRRADQVVFAAVCEWHLARSVPAKKKILIIIKRKTR